VRVEGMTLRIWRARVESVVFGKDGSRQVTAMYASSQAAAQLADDLEAFASRQSVFVAPRAGTDGERLAALQATESLLGGAPAGRADALVNTAAGVAEAARVTSGPARRFCPECGTPAAADAKFCSACGKPLPAA